MPQQMARRLLPAAAALGMLIAMILGASASAQPLSKTEAQAEGNPAGTAPVVVTPRVFVFEGRQIPLGQVEGRNLACLQTATQFECKKSAGEFGGTPPQEEGEVSPDCAVVSALWTYQDKQYEGFATGLGDRFVWVDEPEYMNNRTSSYRMGDYSGHMSDYGGGGGYWFPGDTSACAYMSNIAQYDPGWNDRISSRYRN